MTRTRSCERSSERLSENRGRRTTKPDRRVTPHILARSCPEVRLHRARVGVQEALAAGVPSRYHGFVTRYPWRLALRAVVALLVPAAAARSPTSSPRASQA